MKRTPLKRTKGLDRTSSLKRTPLRSRSKKREEFMSSHRVPEVKAMISAGRKCEVGPILEGAGITDAPTCRKKIEGLHERRKRSSGGSLVNPANLIPSCNPCNGFIEDEPDICHELGLVVREGDSEWEALGRRNDLNG